MAAAWAEGAFAQIEGVWHLDKLHAAGGRLAELVRAQLRRLPPEVRRVVEIVAVAESVDRSVLEGLGGNEATAAARATGMIVDERDSRRRTVRLEHPVIGDVVRDVLDPPTARAAALELAGAVEARGFRERGDVVRVARWRLDAGAVPDVAVLVRAAEGTNFFDPVLCERFARAALDAGDTSAASHICHAMSLFLLGRADEAQRGIEAAISRAEDDEDRMRLTQYRVYFLSQRRPNPDAALAALADSGIPGHVLHELMTVNALVMGGEPRAGLDVVERELDIDPPREPRWRAQHMYWAIVARALIGSVDGLEVVADEARDIARSLEGPTRNTPDRFHAMLALAEAMSGPLDHALELAGSLWQRAALGGPDDHIGVCLQTLGVVHLLEGRVVAAARRFA